jgi:hypothetical protein
MAEMATTAARDPVRTVTSAPPVDEHRTASGANGGPREDSPFDNLRKLTTRYYTLKGGGEII